MLQVTSYLVDPDLLQNEKRLAMSGLADLRTFENIMKNFKAGFVTMFLFTAAKQVIFC